MEPKKEDVLIEIIQHRVHCSREEARNFLKKHHYDLVSAMNEINGIKDGPKEHVIEEVFHVSGEKLLKMLRSLLKQTNLVHLTLQKDQKVLLSIPIAFGVFMFWLYPFISTLTTLYLIKSNYTIKILKRIA
ncbi:DUF4342 domain-containing protein [Tepidibacillus infernus]|uniref:DUF4342 domain-containing protein n=1 Tax=Tepidibacillus decaturensis TaxID=1413211 RepID=A0A135L2L8_9BACI|nr:DUF4342 domain-containing protein [Tepidibacillus decaturensis]KXG43190.1 hypothetical protein U473_03520 [Tepidibacillus decaturensis]